MLGRISAVGAAQRAEAVDASATAPVLTASELRALRAVIDRLIPADELGGGAVAAHVDDYIQRELGGYFKKLLPLYRINLALLDAAAHNSAADSFARLDASRQDELLMAAETGKLGSEWADFFPVVLEHCREGMFGDPMYGGNAAYAGWILIQYPGVKLIFTAQEQATDAELAPAHMSAAQYGGRPAR